MIRITKCKTVGNPGPLPAKEQDIFVYRVLDDDKILATQSIPAVAPAGINEETIAKRILGTFILKDVDVEEITELEDKKLVVKDKLNNIQKDFN